MRNLKLNITPELIYNNLHSIDETCLIADQCLEDVLQIAYPRVVIDAGGYSDGSLTIMVIAAKGDSIEASDWEKPYCIIRCFEYNDFYTQLQRAIDVYSSIFQ